MPFFIRKGTKRKQPKPGSASQKLKFQPNKIKKLNDVPENEIESESDDSVEDDDQLSSSDDEDKYITVQEKKVKLAKKYLDAVELEEKEKLTNENDVAEVVLKKLKENQLEKIGKLKKQIADKVQFDIENSSKLLCKQHSLSITCLVVSHDNQYLFSSSKDWCIVRWSLTNFVKLSFITFKQKKKKKNGAETNNTSNSYHNSTINCLAVSRDDNYLVSGDDKGVINVWHSDTLTHAQTFRGHKSSITDVAICRETNSLYSTSKDALVKVWTLNEMAYLETLFGHQSIITSVDVLNSNRVVTSGGTDKTLRVWKIREESQLVYNGHSGSIDLVKKLDEEFFVSCGDDGALCLWGVLKKKPLHVVETAHGISAQNEEPNWISALAVYSNSDLIASGSCDGCIRLWKWSHSTKTISSLSLIPMNGYVNEMQFTSDGRFLIAGVGKEHRLGRWHDFKEVKNQIVCIPMKINNDTH